MLMPSSVFDGQPRNHRPASLILSAQDTGYLMDVGLDAAAEWLCAGEQPPCRACAHCQKVLAGQHVDVSVMDNGPDAIIVVDAVRRMRKDAFIRPFDSEGKVYIIAYADNLNTAAQNALLVLLEEPPGYARFILLCQNPDALLPTVRSRCLIRRLPISKEERPAPKDRERAEAYINGLFSDWERLAAAYSWEKLNKDDFARVLSALLFCLRERLDSADEARRAAYLARMDMVVECADALSQNASVGSLCGILVL